MKITTYLWNPNPYGDPRTPFGWLWLNVSQGNLDGEPLRVYLPEVLRWVTRHPILATSTVAWAS